MTATESSVLKRRSTERRSARGMSPQSLTTRAPPSRRRHSTMSSMVRYWEKTMDLVVGSARRLASIMDAQASTLADVRHLRRSTRWRIDDRPRRPPPPAAPSTRADRRMGSRQRGQALSLARSASTQAAHAQTWPQLKSIVSRGASRQTTQTSRVAASYSSARASSAAAASGSAGSSASESPASAASAGSAAAPLMPSVTRPLSIVACDWPVFAFFGGGFFFGFFGAAAVAAATDAPPMVTGCSAMTVWRM
mmetsp:Transcript_22328/g.72880  ORF Transcript_22328/g.72880 Transcript_22328/m.72880 type:complete len:251 (+) Transcript_22328:374-1126(+)